MNSQAFLKHLRKCRSLWDFLIAAVVCSVCLLESKGEGNTKEFKAGDPLHSGSVNVDRCVCCSLFCVVNDQLLSFAVIEREFVVLASLCQDFHLLPVGFLIVICNQTHYAALWGAHIENQRSTRVPPTQQELVKVSGTDGCFVRNTTS